jgi:hypothetical protein
MLSKVKDVRQYIKRFIVKDKLNYGKVYALFEKDPEYYPLLKKMLKLKKVNVSPSPGKPGKETKKLKDKHHKKKKVNDENQPITTNNENQPIATNNENNNKR